MGNIGMTVRKEEWLGRTESECQERFRALLAQHGEQAGSAALLDAVREWLCEELKQGDEKSKPKTVVGRRKVTATAECVQHMVSGDVFREFCIVVDISNKTVVSAVVVVKHY